MSWFYNFYRYLEYELPDPRVHDWPLMSSLWVMAGVIAAYLSVVYRVLPKYMASRMPYDLKTLIAVYNVTQVIACVVIINGIATSGWTTHYSFGCEVGDFSEDKMAVRMASYVWWYMMLKVVEMVETGFFILRKKYNQVSPLHVYHHASTFAFAWLAVKYYPTGTITFSLMLNSFVHILMYTYYFLSGLGPDMQKRIEPYKVKLTIIQMVQLVIIFVHSLQALAPSCGLPDEGTYMYLTDILINLGFFAKFYARNYTNKKQKLK